MSDGITDSRKQISDEEYIRIESYRIEMMVRELKWAREDLKKLKEEYEKSKLDKNKKT